MVRFFKVFLHGSEARFHSTGMGHPVGRRKAAGIIERHKVTGNPATVILGKAGMTEGLSRWENGHGEDRGDGEGHPDWEPEHDQGLGKRRKGKSGNSKALRVE